MNRNILRKSNQQAAFSAAIIWVLFQDVPSQNRFLDLIKGEIIRPSFDFSMKRIFILVLLDFLLSSMVILLFPDRDGRAQCIEIVLALQRENNALP